MMGLQIQFYYFRLKLKINSVGHYSGAAHHYIVLYHLLYGAL